MSRQKRFMLVVSPLMQHGAAFDRAAALAKAEGAALHIVAFDYLEGLATAGLVNEQALEQLRVGYVERHHQWLEEQARPMRKIGIEVTTEVVWVERPLEEILIHLKEQPMDMLIKELAHESLLTRIMFTPLDVHLLRKCPVPLHFVSHVHHPVPRRILAAVDTSHHGQRHIDLNERIVNETVKLAMQCNAEAHVLYAYDLSSIASSELADSNGAPFFSSNLDKVLFDAQSEVFNELAERNGVPVQQRHMVMGNPVKALARYAETFEIDVIVMGKVDRHGLGKLIGGTVEHLLYKMPCSVLVIPAEQPEG